MAAFQAVFALGNLHQLGAIAAEVERGSRYYLFSSDRLHCGWDYITTALLSATS
jgi:hypothetical protein